MWREASEHKVWAIALHAFLLLSHTHTLAFGRNLFLNFYFSIHSLHFLLRPVLYGRCTIKKKSFFSHKYGCLSPSLSLFARRKEKCVWANENKWNATLIHRYISPASSLRHSLTHSLGICPNHKSIELLTQWATANKVKYKYGTISNRVNTSFYRKFHHFCVKNAFQCSKRNQMTQHITHCRRRRRHRPTISSPLPQTTMAQCMSHVCRHSTMPHHCSAKYSTNSYCPMAMALCWPTTSPPRSIHNPAKSTSIRSWAIATNHATQLAHRTSYRPRLCQRYTDHDPPANK